MYAPWAVVIAKVMRVEGDPAGPHDNEWIAVEECAHDSCLRVEG